MNLSTLSKDEKRALVAKRQPKLITIYDKLNAGRFVFVWRDGNDEIREREWLEIMRLAEETLEITPYAAFLKHLQAKVGCGIHSISWRNERLVVSATADQRMEAFLQAIEEAA